MINQNVDGVSFMSIKKCLVNYVNKKNKYLKQNGAFYMFPNLNVKVFYIIKIATAAVFGILMYIICPSVFVVMVCLGYLFPDMLLKLSNSSDNDSMMSDIESIYDIMRIQARAGVFIQDSLMDCYSSSKNSRLKAALIELCNQISTSCTMEEAVTQFNDKFNNRHIDILSIVLRQSQTSGKTVQILSDMSEQIRQVRHSMALKEEGRLERKIEFLELLIFIGVLAIGVYSMGNEIIKMISIS